VRATLILLANSAGLVNKKAEDYGTNGINGTDGRIPETLSVCSVISKAIRAINF
jgi:hypothetical protein